MINHQKDDDILEIISMKTNCKTDISFKLKTHQNNSLNGGNQNLKLNHKTNHIAQSSLNSNLNPYPNWNPSPNHITNYNINPYSNPSYNPKPFDNPNPTLIVTLTQT